MKSRHLSSGEYEKSTSDVESGRLNIDDLEDEPNNRSNYQAQSLPKFLFKIGSDFIFYAGAWCCALWILYLFSQLVHNRDSSVAKEMKATVAAGWHHFVDEERNLSNNSLVSGYIDTIELRHLPSVTYDSSSGPPLSSNAHGGLEKESIWSFPSLSNFNTSFTSPELPHLNTPPSKIKPKHHLIDESKKVDAMPVAMSSNEAYCRDMHRRSGVRPGTSWGSMTKKQQGDWMKNRCDKYFCKPDPLEGRGSYKCKPL